MVIRAALFKSMNGFNESFPSAALEDVEFYSRLVRKSIVVQFVPGAIIDHPPRRRRIGRVALKQWQSRVLIEAMLGSVRKEWLPIHVLKVRISDLRCFRLSAAWIPYLYATMAEVIGVTLNARRWKAECQGAIASRAIDSSAIAHGTPSPGSDN